MGRPKVIIERQRLNVWVLNNQVREMDKARKIRGKTKTAVISEALALWLALMRKEGVL